MPSSREKVHTHAYGRWEALKEFRFLQHGVAWDADDPCAIQAKRQQVSPRPSLSILIRAGATLVVFAIAALGVENVIATWLSNASHEQREVALGKVAELRAGLENSLSSTIYLASGLSAFIRSVEAPTEEQIRRALRAVYETDGRIRNIGLAPDNVLRYIYPLESNRAALGLRYEDVPEQWPEVRRAMMSGRAVLAGPLELKQGGQAMINRTPVFLESGEYWGLVSIVIDLDRLLQLAKYNESDGFALGVMVGTTLSPDARWLMASYAAVSDAPVSMVIELPGTSWTVFAAPKKGWEDFSRQVWTMRALLYGVLLLGLIFALTLLEGRARARRMADELHQLNAQLATSNDALEYLSRYDALTNVANRRYFDDSYPRIWGQCRRHGLPLSILMVDVDHFKKINDTYGHQLGDVCLQRVASRINYCLQRADDFVARYGGEEFIVVAAGLDSEQARALGDKIRRQVAGTLIEPTDARIEPFRMTVSVGVATVLVQDHIEPEELCRAADLALYAAKNSGRNCVRHQEIGKT